jgi:hypothetical protein
MNEIIVCFHVALLIGAGLLFFRKGYATLLAWICLQGVLANLFVLKEISLFGFHITCSDALAVGMIFCLNLTREYMGKEKAQKALWTSFASMACFVLLAEVHLFYQPSPHDTHHPLYAALLAPAPRLLAASLLAFLISQKLDLSLFQLVKKRWSHRSFGARNFAVSLLSQLVDTCLFSMLGLYGMVSHISHIILISFLFKILLVVLMTPLAIISQKMAPKVSTDG